MRIPLDIPAGLISDDTTFAAGGRWADSSNVRFWEGRPQTIGGWEALSSDVLTGVCRSVFNWTDLAAVNNVAFGTHSALQVWLGGALYSITPTAGLPGVTLGANPLAVVNGSYNVAVTQPNHGLTGGSVVTLSGAAPVGGITPNGTYSVAYAPDANTFVVIHGFPATSTAVGGGSAVASRTQAAFLSGNINGTGGAGYGTGAYSTGTYSSPSASDYFPRTWSLGAWGQNLIASPRGGTIHAWSNVTATPAAPLLNAPAQVTYCLVAPQDQVFALGCNEEASGVFNPLCIRHCSVRNNTEWSTGPSTTAREYVLPGGGRIVAGRVIGTSLLVWTSHALFLGTFLGSLSQPWRFDRVGEKCGLIGANAAVVVGQSAYWLGPDLQFYQYDLGAAPRPLICPIRDEMADNFAQSQGDKATASSVSAFGEVRFDYPDGRDGLENSRYLTYSLLEGAWSRGVMARSAFVDAGPSPSPIGVRPDGAIYWHERGASADGAPIAWFIETADQYLSEDQTVLVRGVWPDFAHQVGPATLSVTARLKPQDPETSSSVVALSPGDDRADLRASGRLFRVRFSGESSPARWRLGRTVFDVAAAGGR
ncbi:hypothetical protein [Phenylobacterium aquaticum]|uniref:hypothetical protein n=1 Tax=Phenylobacterium aquaticum TaxID=1763816 RepID=UPI0026EA16BA|nr:hypothetical protein [Phenylobacterium aquaticum]